MLRQSHDLKVGRHLLSLCETQGNFSIKIINHFYEQIASLPLTLTSIKKIKRTPRNDEQKRECNSQAVGIVGGEFG